MNKEHPTKGYTFFILNSSVGHLKVCLWERGWRNKKESEWPVLREIFYIARRVPGGTVYGVAPSPNGLSEFSHAQLMNSGLCAVISPSSEKRCTTPPENIPEFMPENAQGTNHLQPFRLC